MEHVQSQAEPVTREAIELPGTPAPLPPLAGHGCCTPAEQEVCCTADGKEECCGTASSEGCGCR